MAKFTHIIILAAIACLVDMSRSEKMVRIIPDSFDTWSDNTYINFSFAMDKSVPYMNVTQKVLKTITELEAHVESEIRAKENGNHFFISNATFSICDVLHLKSIHPMAALAFASIKRHGVVPEKCPIEEGTYRLTKVWPPEENIPTHLPMIEAEFRIQLFAVENGQRHMILNNKFKGHSELGEGTGKSLLSGMFGMKG